MIKLLFLFLNILFLFGSNIEFFGEESSFNDKNITIKNGVLLKDKIIVSANKIIYNKEEKNIIANGDVYINYNKDNFILSNKVYIDLNEHSIEAEPFFLFNFFDYSWINSVKATSKNKFYMGEESIASTCDIKNPDWKIVSTSVDYNKKTKWIDMYNPTLYLKNIPILYLPYLGFSLDKTRSSGFLKPLFGYSDNEGILLTTPYYQTLGISADLEIDPTIRTLRGKGIYSTFRFVHSTTSKGKFKIGSFKDDIKYQTKYNLANRIHRGWSFLYTNNSILNDEDKLYIDLKNANDTDYFYLDAYNYNFQTITDQILTSKINYYIKDNYNYLGIYGTYFKDTSKISNEDTMQILPQINYHKFNDTILKNLSYSVDANIYNYYREKGYKAIKKSIVIPFNYNLNFFNDYLKLGITEQLSLNQVDISDNNISKLSRIDTFVKLHSNLSKKYDDFIHNISFSITFGMDNYYNYNGVESEYLDTSLMEKSVAFNLYQYLISDTWKLNHHISEVYYLDTEAIENRYSSLRNDISIDYYDYYFKDNNKYSIDDKKIYYNSITVGFKDELKNIEGSFIYQKETTNVEKSKSYNLKAYYKFDEFHKLFGEYRYDLVLNMTKYQLFGISMKKRCWNYSFSYKKEIQPLLTNDGISSIIQKTLYFQIELVPLGGIDQQYKFRTEKG